MGRIVYAYTWTVKSSRIRRAVTRSLPQKTDLRGAQIVLPPATTRGTVAITLRRPSHEVWSVGELARRGIFRTTRRASAELDETERELLGLLASQQYETFMRRAVLSRKNILVSGPTGSGKTSWTQALPFGNGGRTSRGICATWVSKPMRPSGRFEGRSG